jgi:DNA repair exonuclease SbcCD ATPase subunit
MSALGGRSLEELRSRAAKLRETLELAGSDESKAASEIADADDESLAKINRRIEGAQERARAAQRQLSAVQPLIAAAEALEIALKADARWQAAQRLASDWLSQGERLQKMCANLAAQFERVFEAGQAFRDSLPVRMPGVEDADMVWAPSRLSGLTKHHLFIESNGRFAHGVMSVWEAQQLRGLAAHLEENIKRAMSKRPRLPATKDAA